MNISRAESTASTEAATRAVASCCGYVGSRELPEKPSGECKHNNIFVVYLSILLTKTTARNIARALCDSFCAAVVFVRSIFSFLGLEDVIFEHIPDLTTYFACLTAYPN